MLFDAVGAAECWEEGGEEREGVVAGNVEAEDSAGHSEERRLGGAVVSEGTEPAFAEIERAESQTKPFGSCQFPFVTENSNLASRLYAWIG